MMSEKKKKCAKTVAIVILSLLLIASLALLSYQLFFQPEPECIEVKVNKEEKVADKGEELPLTDETVDYIYDMVNDPILYLPHDQFFSQEKITIEQLDSSVINTMVLSNYRGDPSKPIAYSDLNEIAQDIFGKSYQFAEASIEGCPKYIYNSMKKEFKKDLDSPCGVNSFEKIELLKVKQVLYQDRYEIESKVAFIQSGEGVFKDPKHQQKISDQEEEFILNVDNANQFVSYLYTFVKKQGRYYFESVELQKT